MIVKSTSNRPTVRLLLADWSSSSDPGKRTIRNKLFPNLVLQSADPRGTIFNCRTINLAVSAVSDVFRWLSFSKIVYKISILYERFLMNFSKPHRKNYRFLNAY